METALQVAQKLSEQTLPVGQDTLQQIASILVRTELKKGENFLDEGAVCSQIGYIYKGLVRQYYYKNGKQLTEHFSCENDVFILSRVSCGRSLPLLSWKLWKTPLYMACRMNLFCS